ncbi:MAG: hypothetical protein QOJ97_1172, partial [Solirubrobacteraceae bacterium]|nr:hypothetical protein [Solirubrobacteraceae bacterium]
DDHGVPRARCRCGNPLLEPVYIPEATCYGCPPNYHPPPECNPWSDCYEVYKHPPPVMGSAATTTTPTTPSQGPQVNPQAYFTPSTGGQNDAFTLHISGFSPNANVTFTIVRPNGGQDPTRSISTDGSGSGTYYFPPPGSSNMPGAYTATIHDPTGATTTATATVVASGGGGSGGGQQNTTGDGGGTSSGQKTTPQSGATIPSG